MWVFRVDIESGDIQAAALNICCGTLVSAPCLFVKQIRFYSPLLNNPTIRWYVATISVVLLYLNGNSIQLCMAADHN